MFAIVPSIAHWHGDMRRNYSPYFITTGITYGDLNVANMAMRILNKKGIRCHMEVLTR